MSNPITDGRRHRILIIGGGNAGISVAARLRRAGQSDVAVIEPSDTHYYQPAWTLVGGGAYPQQSTARPMEGRDAGGSRVDSGPRAEHRPRGKVGRHRDFGRDRLRLPRRRPGAPARLGSHSWSPRGIQDAERLEQLLVRTGAKDLAVPTGLCWRNGALHLPPHADQVRRCAPEDHVHGGRPFPPTRDPGKLRGDLRNRDALDVRRARVFGGPRHGRRALRHRRPASSTISCASIPSARRRSSRSPHRTRRPR